MTIKTHKATGWQRQALGFGSWKIVPTDGSGERVVRFMSAHSWQNLPNDRREDIGKDRVVLESGDPLPEWAVEWLSRANGASCQSGRDALAAALYDADMHQASREGW